MAWNNFRIIGPLWGESLVTWEGGGGLVWTSSWTCSRGASESPCRSCDVTVMPTTFRRRQNIATQHCMYVCLYHNWQLIMRWVMKLNHSPFNNKLRFSSSVTCAYLLPHVDLEKLQLYDACLYATTVASETIIDTDLEINHDISQDMTMIIIGNRSDPEQTKSHLHMSFGAFCISYSSV